MPIFSASTRVEALALDLHRELVGAPLQALGVDLGLDEFQQVYALALELARLEGRGVEAQQRLDLALQLHRVLAQDAGDLALVVVELAGHAFLEQRDTLAQCRQRRLELVRDVAQETRLIGIELGQPQPQPIELLADAVHVGRALDLDGLVQPVLAQAHDGAFHALERARQPQAQRDGQQHGQHHHADHLLRELHAAGVQLGVERLAALLDGGLHLLRQRDVEHVEFAELGRHGALAVQCGLGRALHELLDPAHLAAPARGQRRRQVGGLQAGHQALGLARAVGEAPAQQRVAQDQRLARGPLGRGAALAERLRHAVQLQRARREAEAALHQYVEGEHRAHGHAAQQRGDQQEGQQ